MQLSVVILNYNVSKFLEQCVLSVQNAIQSIDAEIIVVDNNSSDDSCQMIKKRFPSIKLIENKENCGFPKGNNIGVAEAKGDYLCILNPDTVVSEDTFTKILDFAKSKPDLGIIGCHLIDGTGNFLPESKRGVPTPWVAFTKVLGLYRYFPKNKWFNQYYEQNLAENQTGKVAILVGALMVLKRDLYNEVGGFDENCFMYSDDIDLSYMILKKGKSNYYFHETTVIHYKGESTIRDNTYMKRFREAMHFFYNKHFKVSVLFDIFMKIGVLLFSIFKKNQAVVESRKIDTYFVVTGDEKTKNKVENLLGKKVTAIHTSQKNTLHSLLGNRKINYEIIFDNNHISFKSIIQSMKELKNLNCTFKILPKNSNFIIGSNSSFDRGEILEILE